MFIKRCPLFRMSCSAILLSLCSILVGCRPGLNNEECSGRKRGECQCGKCVCHVQEDLLIQVLHTLSCKMIAFMHYGSLHMCIMCMYTLVVMRNSYNIT